MPTLKLVVSLESDGKQVPGFPVVRRLTVPETQQFAYEKADDGDAVTFSAVPADQLAEIQALVLRTDQQLTFRFDGQSDAGIVLNAGGVLVFLDSDIDAGAGANNAKVNNDSGSTANVVGFAGGT